MPEIQQEETQQELFAEFSGAAKRLDRFPSIQKTNKPVLINTSLEQVILAAISLILVGCFVFFLGVLRGQFISVEPKKNQIKINANSQISAPKAAQESEVLVKSVLNKPYTIQLSTYKRLDLAQKEAVALKKAGFFCLIIPTGEHYQLCVGQYADKEKAKKDLKNFNRRYKGAFLRRK